MSDSGIILPPDLAALPDDGAHFGLGADQSPPDERDYMAATELVGDELLALPTSFKTRAAPVLNQGDTPRCVSFATSGVQAAHDRSDYSKWMNFDEAKFAALIGTTSNGAYLRDAVARLKDYGYPALNSPTAQSAHRVGSYYFIPKTVVDLKAALYGPENPVLFATPWYHSWFHPTSAGKLPSPDYKVGGHAIYIYGWDDSRSAFLCRNSWGSGWGPISGDFWLPYSYALSLVWEFWRTVDVTNDPIAWVHAVVVDALTLGFRAQPNVTAASVGPDLKKGAKLAATKLRRYGGAYRSIDGTTRTDWIYHSFGGKTGWSARGYTHLA